MPFFISASPDPVIFSYPEIVHHQQKDVNLGWDTGDAQKARVYRSVDGTMEAALPGPAATHGSAIEKISIDQVITYILRRSPGGAEMARTTVTTAKDTLATIMTDPDHDFIHALKIDVGVDHVEIGFETKGPALSVVELRRKDDGALLESQWGSLFQQVHHVTCEGLSSTGLPQDTALDVRIVALKDRGGGRVVVGAGAGNPEVRGQVTTGERTVRFTFDLVHVRNDGDGNGPGEFTFTFGVGDELTRAQLGPTESWGEGEISSGGDRDLGKIITVDHAPRLMWAQATGWEDDGSIVNPGTWGFGVPGLGPSFPATQTDGWESDYGALAWVGAHFDTRQAPGRDRPFQMSTGDFSISYDVFGSLKVTERSGKNEFKGLALGRVPRKPKLSARAAEVGAQLLGGRTRTFAGPEALTTVTLGADGRVGLRDTDRRSGAASLVDLGGFFRTDVTVVPGPRLEALYVVGLTPSGGGVVRIVDPRSPTSGDWIELGGAFTGEVVAVVRGSALDVLARDADGQVFHMPLAGGRSAGRWALVGKGARALAACVTEAGDLGLFALGLEAQLLHQRLTRDGAWRPGAGEWDVLRRPDVPGAAEDTLGVSWATDVDLAVSVLAGDALAGALFWPSYPHPDGPRWQPVEVPEAAEATTGATPKTA